MLHFFSSLSTASSQLVDTYFQRVWLHKISIIPLKNYKSIFYFVPLFQPSMYVLSNS